MIRINLLPVREERRKTDLQQFGLILGMTLLGSILLVGLYHMKLSHDVSEAKATVAATQKEINRFEPQLRQLEEYRKTKAEIEKKLEVIERLDASRSGPVHVFDELATHAPSCGRRSTGARSRATASSTPFTNFGDGASPKRRASSIA